LASKPILGQPKSIVMKQKSPLLLLICFLAGLSQTKMQPVLNEVAQRRQPFRYILKQKAKPVKYSL